VQEKAVEKHWTSITYWDSQTHCCGTLWCLIGGLKLWSRRRNRIAHLWEYKPN